jgi:hypothetical protein
MFVIIIALIDILLELLINFNNNKSIIIIDY